MRIGFVDLIKLLFSFIVCYYHFYNVTSPNPYWPLGDVAVELFVLIAGVFFFAGLQHKAEKGITESPYAYLKKRFCRFFPYSFWGYLLAFAAAIYLSVQSGTPVTGADVGDWLSDGIWDVLMVKMNGMNSNQPFLNTPAWTLSAMLISEFTIHSLLYNNKKLFETFIAPSVILVGLGFWRHIPSASHQLWIGFTTFGLLRVFILYCLSWYCFKLFQRLQKLSLTRFGRLGITASEILAYLWAIMIMTSQTSRNYRWVATLLLFFSVAVSISGKSYTAKAIPFSKWTGEFSMGIYLTHYPIMKIFRAWFPGTEVLEYVLPFSLVVILASFLFCVILRISSIVIHKAKTLLTPVLLQPAEKQS